MLIGLLASKKTGGLPAGLSARIAEISLKGRGRESHYAGFTAGGDVQCREKLGMHRGGFDVEALQASEAEEDAGVPYITMGMCCTPPGRLPQGERMAAIHRLCLQSADEMTMFFTPGCITWTHFGKKRNGKAMNLPIDISISVDPAIEMLPASNHPQRLAGF